MSIQRKKSRLNERLQFSSVQDYENIKLRHRNGELFEDAEFAAGPAVLTDDVEGQTIVINYMGKTHVRRAEIEWLRPRVGFDSNDIYKGSVHQFKDCMIQKLNLFDDF